MSTYTELLSRVTVTADEGRPVNDPATGEIVGFVREHSVEHLETAVRAAKAAQPSWAALGHARRIDILTAVADRIDARSEPLAELLSREQGKPLNGPNARFEVGACSAWLRAAASTVLDSEVVVDDGQSTAVLTYKPIGVVGAIGPWNWPLMIGMWQMAPSLRMGNTVVLKPSSNTPLSVLALISIMNEVLPPDVLTAVCGTREIGSRLAEHPDIAKVMFTGSTAAGREIIKSSAKNLARLTLELGGNDAGIVLPGTDPKEIAENLFWGAFINTGQTCAALKRLYVHDSLYEEVIAALKEVSDRMPMGNGLDEANVLGPLQNQKQFDIVVDLVEDAKAHGGRVITGGSPATELGDLFYPITLIADLADGDRLVDEEQFGPALPIIRYSEIGDAVASANRLETGLGASVWSSDPAQAREIAGPPRGRHRVDQPTRHRASDGTLRRREGLRLRPRIRRRGTEVRRRPSGHQRLNGSTTEHG